MTLKTRYTVLPFGRPHVLGELFFLLIVSISPGHAAPRNQQANLGVSEILAKHLDALGTATARNKVELRSARGTAEFEERLAHKFHLAGSVEMNSKGRKIKCTFHFEDPKYPGERLMFDGLSLRVAGIDEQYNSRLGAFLVKEPGIVREGLWGGALSTAWPLLDATAVKSKINFEGLKIVDNRELYELAYAPESDSEHLSIRLYFDPATFQHVLTVYRLSDEVPDGPRTGLGHTTTIVEEHFSDFRTTDGLTLPALWIIRLRTEPETAFEFQWTTHLDHVFHYQL